MACYSIPLPPPELQHHLKKETYDKAQAYGRDKLTFNVRQTVFNFVLGFVLIKARLFAHAWDWTASLMDTVGLEQNRVVCSPTGRADSDHPLAPLDHGHVARQRPPQPLLDVLLHLRH